MITLHTGSEGIQNHLHGSLPQIVDYISIDNTDDDVTEFRRAVLEHLAAEKHQLPGIQQLAMHKIEHMMALRLSKEEIQSCF
jgi:hypothetical protein